jgi:Protein of unknown function (DUF3987)
MLDHQSLQKYLPDNLYQVVDAVERKTQAPLEIIVNAMLASGALALQRRYEVVDPDGIIKPVSLNILTIADSGERKTTVDKYFSAPFFEFEAQQKRLADQDSAEKQFQQIYFEERMKIFKGMIKESIENGKDSQVHLQAFKEIQADQPQPDKLTKIIYQDATIPALIDGLHHNNASAALMSSEAGSILGGNATADLPLLNQLWDGEPISFKRKRPQTDIYLTNARLTVSLMTQYGPFRKFVNARQGNALEVGFLARCLFSYPVSRQGYRFNTLHPQDAHYYDSIIGTHQRFLLDLFTSTEPTKTIEYSSDTWHHYTDIKNNIESRLREGGQLSEHRGYGSKYCNNLSRIAAIIALLSHKTIIDNPSLEAAQYLMNHYLNEYLNVYFRTRTPEKLLADFWRINQIITNITIETCSSSFKKKELDRIISSSLDGSKNKAKDVVDLLVKMRVIFIRRFYDEIFYTVVNPNMSQQDDLVGIEYFDFKTNQKTKILPNFLKVPVKSIGWNKY